MSFSMNEIEAQARKAARGAGYPWGIADEAGRATRMLCENGFDGVAMLARVLASGFAAKPEVHRPTSLETPWSGEAALCPLLTGATLADCAGDLRTQEIGLRNVAEPMMLLPFAALAARRLESCVQVLVDDAEAVTDGVFVSGTLEAIDHAKSITVKTAGGSETRHPRNTRATPNPTAWAALNSFAHRTYAPATEASRTSGAGAGLTDND